MSIMESLFSTLMRSFLETLLRIQLANQNKPTKIAHEMIIVMEHFATDFQKLKASTAEKIDKTELLLWENVMGHDTVQTEDMKQQVELLEKENNRLRMESESLFKVIELLSVQQKLLVKSSKDNFLTAKETREYWVGEHIRKEPSLERKSVSSVRAT